MSVQPARRLRLGALLGAAQDGFPLLEQISQWEKEQSEKESEWRLRQSRMHLEFEERKRRLQEQQLGQRKKMRETYDAALRPLYAEGLTVCEALEKHLKGKLCRLCEHGPPSSAVPQSMPVAKASAPRYAPHSHAGMNVSIGEPLPSMPTAP